LPDVVETTPRLADGTPFPTLFYLTCPRAVHECSRLESAGLMKEMSARLAADPELVERYRAAHEDYLRRRAAIGQVPEIEGVSAGGMPTRVKCLHALLGHALAVGPGVNPFGDETLEPRRAVVDHRPLRVATSAVRACRRRPPWRQPARRTTSGRRW
jgi:hypothetical protein